MGGVITVPDLPFLSSPPPDEKYVFRVQSRDTSISTESAKSTALTSSTKKRRGSSSGIQTLPGPTSSQKGVTTNENTAPGVPLQSQKSAILKSQPSGIIIPGSLKSQLSGLPGAGTLKSQQSLSAMGETMNASLNRRPSAIKLVGNLGVGGGYRVSSKHSWILKGGIVQPRSSSEFTFGKIIGRGLMGVVRIVKHNPSNAYIAIKAIRKDYIEKHHDSRHVAWEKEALGSVCSSFVPVLFGSFQDESYVYFAMELAVGGELFRRLSRKQSLGPQTAKFYTCEIFSALLHIQELGYAYRDLKPENVMVDEEGHCKLVDFGFVRMPDENGMMKTFCGTPAYLSPEQLDHKFTGGYTNICDWWSLGVFLYELRTGIPPFCKNHRETVYAVYTRILHNKISFPSHIQPDERELISNLCLLNKEKRLKDPNKIKNAKYFEGVDWDAVDARRLVPPFVPALHSVGDDRFFEDCALESQVIKAGSSFMEGDTQDREYMVF